MGTLHEARSCVDERRRQEQQSFPEERRSPSGGRNESSRPSSRVATTPPRAGLPPVAFAGLLVAGASFATAPPAEGQGQEAEIHRRYRIVRLETLGGPSGNALRLNSKGRVAGASDNAGGLRHACLWTDSLEDLDPGHPASISEAWGINDAQDVVGFLDMYGTHRAMLWTRESGAVDLFPGSPLDSYAHDVNDAQELVGTHGASAFFWGPDTGARTLQTLGGYSRAWSVNRSGDVAGSSVQGQPKAEVPTVWERDATTGSHGAPLRLVPGSAYGVAYGINDAGHAVGWSSDGSSTNATAFLSERSGGCRELTFLGRLPQGSYSVARAINGRNQVVGAADTVGAPWGQAFYWDEHAGMLDLNELIPPPDRADWDLIQANDISDGGEIVGYGLHFPTGAAQAFLLVPAPAQVGS